MSKRTDTSARLLLSSGNGPMECRLALAKLHERACESFEASGLSVVSSSLGSTDKLPPSYLLKVTGINIEVVLKQWVGSILWIAPSPFRSNHKRKNWFVGIHRLTNSKDQTSDLSMTDLKFETFRAGGPGGQHQNTTDSAVRCTHLPTGLSAVARDNRSQHRNKQAAMDRLAFILMSQDAEQIAELKAQERLLHHRLERGNPIRTFKGDRFVEVT